MPFCGVVSFSLSLNKTVEVCLNLSDSESQKTMDFRILKNSRHSFSIFSMSGICVLMRLKQGLLDPLPVGVTRITKELKL